jgi:ATP-dependent DNA helicase HFM1/MER3
VSVSHIRPALTGSDKVFLFLQATFGNIEMEDKKSSENASIKATIMVIYKDAVRIAKGTPPRLWHVLTIAICSVAKLKAENEDRGYGKAVRSALELLRTIVGKAWENTATIFRQLDNIGPKSIGKLNAEGIISEYRSL